MRRPRFRMGFRLFVLLVTLASVLAATVAVRNRPPSRSEAMYYSFEARRSREEAAWLRRRARAWAPGDPRRVEAEAMASRLEEWAAVAARAARDDRDRWW